VWWDHFFARIPPNIRQASYCGLPAAFACRSLSQVLA
jgi:hypothetical protein